MSDKPEVINRSAFNKTDPIIFGHVTLVDVDGEPIKIRCWMPGEECRDYTIDLPSFWLLVRLVMKAMLKRAPKQ